jgi:hypothetical protein
MADEDRNEFNGKSGAGDREAKSEAPEGGVGGPAVGCPDCHGSGSVLLLISRRPCERCCGTGRIGGGSEGNAGSVPSFVPIAVTRCVFDEGDRCLREERFVVRDGQPISEARASLTPTEPTAPRSSNNAPPQGTTPSSAGNLPQWTIAWGEPAANPSPSDGGESTSADPPR